MAIRLDTEIINFAWNVLLGSGPFARHGLNTAIVARDTGVGASRM
jgi:hypothetical protein